MGYVATIFYLSPSGSRLHLQIPLTLARGPRLMSVETPSPRRRDFLNTHIYPAVPRFLFLDKIYEAPMVDAEFSYFRLKRYTCIRCPRLDSDELRNPLFSTWKTPRYTRLLLELHQVHIYRVVLNVGPQLFHPVPDAATSAHSDTSFSPIQNFPSQCTSLRVQRP